jgi:NADH dehydrogenase
MKARKLQRVVIVGAGFAGLSAARALASSPVEVVLLDRNNYHTFLPLLYQVAAAKLEPELLAYPLHRFQRKLANVRFLMASVKRLDLVEQVVVTNNALIPYDFLILASGSTEKFSEIPGASTYAFPLKTLEQAISLRNHILNCFERAAHEPNASRRQQLLTFVIVGGGPTGVEFAGALVELICSTLLKDYPTLDFQQVRVVLLQAGSSLLPYLPKWLHTYTERKLHQLGVAVHLKTRVNLVTQEAVHLLDGGLIPTETVIWTAGVQGNLSDLMARLPTDSAGQVAVKPTLQVESYNNVYAIGDIAAVKLDGQKLPMLAPVAIQQGITAARNIARQIEGRSPLPFRYQNLGNLVIIGRHAAVAQLGKLTFTGFPAWVLWQVVHLVKLSGFRNRCLVLMNWIFCYLFREHGVSLVLPKEPMLTSASRPQLLLRLHGKTP